MIGGRVGGRSSRVCADARARDGAATDTAGAIVTNVGMATKAAVAHPMQCCAQFDLHGVP
ncbi:MAG: hypothetical protein DYH18_00855 [Xanthomonadales bacterium PRO7]|nr:hypothetical protein [Xanthomonadales bacterium PRO7]